MTTVEEQQRQREMQKVVDLVKEAFAPMRRRAADEAARSRRMRFEVIDGGQE
jgi:hypothetical protein